MAANGNTNGGGSSGGGGGSAAAQRAGLAQALDELAKGEQAAARLEAELGQFEARLDALLAAFGPAEAAEEAAEAVAAVAAGGNGLQSHRRASPTKSTVATTTATTRTAAEGQPAADAQQPDTAGPGGGETKKG